MGRQGCVIAVVGTLLCACLLATTVKAQEEWPGGPDGGWPATAPGSEPALSDPLAPSYRPATPTPEGWFVSGALAPQTLALRPGAPEPEWRARFGAGLRHGPASFTLYIRHSDDLPLADQLALALTARYQF